MATNKERRAAPEDRYRYTYSGLPGTSGDVMTAEAASVADAMRCVRAGVPVGTAGDSGAITVYRDDEGRLRCDFQRYMVTLSHEITGTQKRTREWLNEWWPRMGR